MPSVQCLRKESSWNIAKAALTQPLNNKSRIRDILWRLKGTTKKMLHPKISTVLDLAQMYTTLLFWPIVLQWHCNPLVKSAIRHPRLTGGSYWPKTNAFELHFARSFKGHPTWPYFARPNMHANMHIWHIWPYLAYLGTYLGASTMVKWGVPEKILQNAVQTR